MIRLFLAVNILSEIKERISEAQSELKKYAIGNFVSKENFHFTLKFIGYVEESSLEKIKKACSDVKFKSFDLDIKSVGGFPSKNNPRVIWVGAKDGLKLLHSEVNSKVKFGKIEDREFQGHLTLVRVKRVIDKAGLLKWFEKHSSSFGQFKVDHFSLMKSELRREGPIYSEVERFKLKS